MHFCFLGQATKRRQTLEVFVRCCLKWCRGNCSVKLPLQRPVCFFCLLQYQSCRSPCCHRRCWSAKLAISTSGTSRRRLSQRLTPSSYFSLAGQCQFSMAAIQILNCSRPNKLLFQALLARTRLGLDCPTSYPAQWILRSRHFTVTGHFRSCRQTSNSDCIQSFKF
jgi:hypothetical protein